MAVSSFYCLFCYVISFSGKKISSFLLLCRPGRNHCDISEDETTGAVQEMNLQLISQNRNCLQYNASRGDIGNSNHTNSNVNSETMTNKIKKIKSKPEGSSSILIETNQPLVEKNGIYPAVAKRDNDYVKVLNFFLNMFCRCCEG